VLRAGAPPAGARGGAAVNVSPLAATDTLILMKIRGALSGLWFVSVVAGALVVAAGVVPSAGCSGGVETEDPADAGADGPEVILDGGGTIPTPPDGPSLCPPGACNYQTNAGCSPPEGCIPYPDGQGNAPPTCFPLGQGASGAACQSADQCALGHLCAGGTCRKLCCGGDWTGCPAGESCIQGLSISDGNGGTLKTGAMLCQPVNTCDALDPYTGCPVGTACQIVDPTGATACFQEGNGGSGEPCPCKGGFLCVSGECRRLCKAVEGGGEPSCQEGEGICVHFHRDPPGVGECTPED
jgi:hypothetical protein